MQVKAMLPTVPEIVREGLIIMAGALLATAVIRLLPATARQLFTFPTSNQ